MLTVVDSHTLECPQRSGDWPFQPPGDTVVDSVTDQRGKPEVIRCDNGPGFTSRHFFSWTRSYQLPNPQRTVRQF